MMGLPPVRGGGLVKYVLDLAYEQNQMGHKVVLMVPGCYDGNSDIPKIRYKKWHEFDCYFVVNPLPVTMGRRLSQVEMLYRACDRSVFFEFLHEVQPDVVHIHSFMGLYREFLQVAHELEIRVVFTTHDYYGLCPGTTLFCGKFMLYRGGLVFMCAMHEGGN